MRILPSQTPFPKGQEESFYHYISDTKGWVEGSHRSQASFSHPGQVHHPLNHLIPTCMQTENQN